MTILWMDGLDRYGAIADIDMFYVRSFTMSYSSSNGINGGGCVECTTGYFARTFETAGSLTSGGTVHAFVNWRCQTLPGSANQFLMLNTNLISNSVTAASLIIDSTGKLSVNKHGVNFGTTIASSAAGVIATGQYYRIEYAAKFNTFANGGFIKVWVNGNLVIDTTLTSQDTNSGTVPSSYTGMLMGCFDANHTHRFDDPVAWDEVGSDFNTTQLSASWLPYIEVRAVSANDTVQWTPLSSTNASNVDETGLHDGDTTYNSDSTVGHQDSFTVPSQAGGANATFAVAVKMVSKIDIAGTINLRVGIISGSTTAYSGDFLQQTSYKGWNYMWGRDPDTGPSAWGATAASGIKILYKYQS